jgi:hypothetical protein
MKRYDAGISVVSPEYMLYMAAFGEQPSRMDRLVERVDACQPGESLDGVELARELELSVPVVRAMLSLYAENKLGLLARSAGMLQYRALA